VKDVTFELPCQAGGQVVVGRGRPDAVIVPLPCMRKGPELPAAARQIAGLAEAGKAHRFGAVVLDGGETLGEYPGLAGAYPKGERIPGDELPRVFSGKPTAPAMVFK
jgi:hypothetical protein